jgi:hypothetical protein
MPTGKYGRRDEFRNSCERAKTYQFFHSMLPGSGMAGRSPAMRRRVCAISGARNRLPDMRDAYFGSNSAVVSRPGTSGSGCRHRVGYPNRTFGSVATGPRLEVTQYGSPHETESIPLTEYFPFRAPTPEEKRLRTDRNHTFEIPQLASAKARISL